MSDQSDNIAPDGYIQLDLQIDVDTLTETGFTYMTDAFDEWERNEGNPDTVMVESAGQIAGELGDQAAQMPPEAMVYIGTSIYGIPMLDGTPSVADAVMHFEVDTPSFMVDADTPVAVPFPSGPGVIFVTDRDVLSPAGGGDVPLQVIADQVGESANGAFGEAQLVDPLDGLSSITVSESEGGTDPETAQDYLNRLSDLLTTQAPRPILPNDHATLASSVPGVGRVTAIDLLCPGTTAEPNAIRDPMEVPYFQGKTPPVAPPVNNLVNEPRCTTVSITGLDGAAPDHQLMLDVWTVLDAAREVNFLNYVVPPTYTSIDVKGQIKPYPNYTADAAISAAVAMLELWLSPATYGANPGSPTGRTWANDTMIRHDEAVDYINRGMGVWYSANIQLKKSSDPTWSNGDIALTGVAPLPQIGTITITAIP